MNAIFTRTSVRNYKELPVEAEKIEKIMRAAMAAPSAVNQQPWEFYVVTNKTVLEKLAAASPYAAMTAKAPAPSRIISQTNTKNLPRRPWIAA